MISMLCVCDDPLEAERSPCPCHGECMAGSKEGKGSRGRVSIKVFGLYFGPPASLGVRPKRLIPRAPGMGTHECMQPLNYMLNYMLSELHVASSFMLPCRVNAVKRKKINAVNMVIIISNMVNAVKMVLSCTEAQHASNGPPCA